MSASSHVAHSLLRNVGSSLAGTLGARLLTMAMVVVLARFAGSASLGLYVLAFSFTTIFNLLLADTSINMAAVKDVSQKPELTSFYLRAMPRVNLLVGVLMFAACMAIGGWLYRSNEILLQLVALLAASNFLQGVAGGYRWYFKAICRFDFDAGLNWITSGVALLTGVPLLLWTHDVRGYCIGIVLGSGLGALYAALTVRGLARARQIPPAPAAQGRLSTVVWQAMPYAAMTIVVTAMLNVDVVLLGHWSSPSEIGLYGVGSRLASLLRVASNITLPVLFPFLAVRFERARRHYVQTFGAGFAFMFTLGGGMVACLSFAGYGLIHPIFGAAYAGAAPILALLTWSVLLAQLSGILGMALIAQGRIRTSLSAVFWGLAVEITGCVLLVPRLGPVGCAAAAVITEAVVFVYSAAALRSVLRESAFYWRPRCLKASVATLGALATSLAVRGWYPEVQLLLTASTFLGLGAGLRLFAPAELRKFRALVSNDYAEAPAS